MKTTGLLRATLTATALLSLAGSAFGQATYHVAQAYEDTVRVAVLWNDPNGDCPNDPITSPVGQRTRDTVLASIARVAGKGVLNIKIARTDTMTWAKILAMWPGKYPHTIVHVNAGWVTFDVTNGNVGLPPDVRYNTFEALLDSATDNKVGLVEIGDDAAWLSTRTFGFTGVSNSAAPMNAARDNPPGCCQDSLWIGLMRTNDDKLKTWDARNPGRLEYPYVNGVISNTVDSILRVAPTPDVQLFCKDYLAGRCTMDADKYSVSYPAKTTFLGYQQGWVGTAPIPDAAHYSDFSVIVAIQDTTGTVNNPIVRRAVSLSYQPQYLRNRAASQQIIYDAVMYTSLTHTLGVATKFVIVARDDTLRAGDTLPLKAYIIDQKGDTIADPATINRISWSFDPAYPPIDPTDKIIQVTRDSILFTGTKAYHIAHIFIALNNTTVDTSITVTIIPAAPSHLVIEPAGTPPPNSDFPINTTTIGPAQTTARGYAVLRDRFQNYVRYSQSTLWGSNQPLIVTVPAAGGGNATIGEGVFTKVGPMGTARVGAMDNGLGFKDTVIVIVSQTEYDSLAIYRFAGGVYTRIYRTDTLSLALLDSAVLVVRGRRIDNHEWELVSSNWDITAALKSIISRQPPQSSNSWTFYPTDTGRGYINVSYLNNPSTPPIKDSIHVLFKPGAANVIEIYSRLGVPNASNPAWPADPRVADTMSADSIYTLLYAKVFNYSATTKIWLSTYETVYDSSNKIRWTVSPVDKDDSLLNVTGNHTQLKSTQAYRLVRVTASLGTLTPYSVLVYVTYGKPDHLVIEGSATIRDSGLINDQPLSSIVIGSNQVIASAFAIVRDIYGNFINYSTITLWTSTNTALFAADTGLTSIGEGIAIRRADSGNALMIAANSTVKPGTVLRDTVPVILQNITYKKLRIYVLNGPNKVYLDTIRISTDASLTLYAEGQRSDDTTRWDPVPVGWNKTAGLKTIDPPPASFTLNWNVRPDSIGTGRISVATPDAGTFSLPAIFTEGPADQIVIYRRLGDPSRLFPFPAIDTVMAGSTDTLVGKMFDRNGTWLSRFENINVSRNVISWSIQRINGPALNPGDTVDDLSAKTGHFTTFTPKIAYTTYHIVVQYKDSIKTRVDSANIYVKPGPAHHLVIEPSADITGNKLINDNPFNPDTIRFGSRDNTKTAYAIIRDVYGNFVGFSTTTLWTSLNGQLVVASEGTQTIGEGIINRSPGALVGKTGVTAVNRQNPSLFDGVGILLDNVDYDSLKIVVGDTIHITDLKIQSGKDTLLRVVGKRSTDGLWVPVPGNWVYAATLGGASISGQSSWRFAPTDTGTGTIVVSMGTSVPDMITVTVLPGPPKSVVIYNSELPPGPGVIKLADPSEVITISAGSPYLLVAKVFDWKGVWLSQYQNSILQNLISWGAQDAAGNLNSKFDGLTGAVKHFTPTKAYDTVMVIDTLRADANNMFMDTVRFAIVPGAPYRLVIEPKGAIDVNRANEIQTLEILSNEQSKAVYSTIRDKNSNFIRYADVSLWESFDTTIVKVQKGNNLFGEGIVIRNPLAPVNSITKISAVDAASALLKDTCAVKLDQYYLLALRIVNGNDTNPSNLVMTTNDSVTLRVQGMRSSDSVWINVSATWQNSANLKITPAGPTDSSWTFSPSDTGTGWIRVTLNNDGVTKPDTLPVRFTPGPPVRASIEIITPADSLIAGKPIQAVIRVYDKDGNSYSYTFDTTAGSRAAYHDTLGTGGVTFPEPFIIVDGDTIKLDQSPWGSGNQTFVNGRDTVSLTLYYAPSDTPHQIYANLIIGTTTIRAASAPFILHPDNLSEIRIEYPNGTPVADTVNLTGPVTIYARGYDKYGNKIGDIVGNWSVGDSLHPISGPTDGSSITYDSRLAAKNEKGPLIVNHNGITDTAIIIIKGPLIRLVRAITRDLSGNGILDQIELDFSRKFKLPANASLSGLTIVANQHDTLVVSSIHNIAGAGENDSVWIVELTESHTDQPQTAWTPKVYLPLQSAYDLAAITLTATDGAGPVVWRVVSYPVAAGRHDLDTVVVTFSEPVQRWDGGSLNQSDSPDSIFYVWKQDSSGFYLIDSMFTGIKNLKHVSGRSNSLTFTMSNNQDLNGNYFLSIADSTRKYVSDTTVFAVRPNMNNKPKRVEVGPGPSIIELPVNPIGPTFRRESPGVFNVVNNPNAEKWVKDDKQGAVIKFSFPPLPQSETNAHINCKIRIYDVIGNVVQSSDKPDFLQNGYRPDQLDNRSTVTATIYWNGSNGEGMAVAPGVYRVVVYMEYKGISAANKRLYSDRRMVAKLGVQK